MRAGSALATCALLSAVRQHQASDTRLFSCYAQTAEPWPALLHSICLVPQLLEHPGRPSLTTVDNNTSHPQTALLEHVPPTQTGPYQLQQACSSGLMAEWQQELRVDVSPDLLMQQDALLLLEVLQMPASFKRYRVCAAPDMKSPCRPNAAASSVVANACTVCWWAIYGTSNVKASSALRPYRPSTQHHSGEDSATAGPTTWVHLACHCEEFKHSGHASAGSDGACCCCC